jgi:type II secretory pathway pseudopilin PulG
MAQRTANLLRGQGGASLVEVMISLALLAVLSSTFAAQMRDLTPFHRWEQGARQVAEILRAARQQAIATNAECRVNLQEGRVEVPSAPELSTDLPAGVRITTMPGDGRVSFYPGSTCNTVGPIAVSFTDASGRVHDKVITLVLATGRVLVRGG